MRRWFYIAIFTLLLGVVGCSKEATEPDTEQGKLRLTLHVGGASRAEVPGDGVAADGGGMVDLTLILINPLGAEVASQTFTNLTDTERQRKTVEFSNLDIGNYTLYAYANTQNNSALATDAKASQQTNDTFTTLTGTAVPEIDGVTPMLLTAQRVIPIGMGTTEATIDLLRPVVSFAFELHNHSNYPITVTDLSFSRFNASTSYILPHDGAIPATNTYRNLPAYNAPQVVSVKEAAHAETTGWKELYHTYLFENRATSYTFDMELQTTWVVTSEQEVLGSTAVTSPAEEIRYVIKQQGQTRYITLNNTSLTTVTVPLGNESAYWYFIPNGNGYRIQNVGSGRYLRYNNGLTTTTNANQATTFTYSNNRLSFSSSGRTYYLHYNNGLTTTRTNNATQWQFYAVEVQTSSSEQTRTHTVSDSPLMVIDRQTAAVTPMHEQLRNQQIRVVVNAYINDTNGAFNFEVVPWEERSADITFGE